MTEMTESQRKVINASIDDMIRHHRNYADMFTVSPRADVRRRMAEAGWLETKGRFARLTRKAFEAVGRLDVYPGTVTPVVEGEVDNRCADCLEDLDKHCEDCQECECVCEDKRLDEDEDEDGGDSLDALEEAEGLVDPENVGRVLGGVAGPPAPVPASGSTVVALIERVWDRIRAEHPDLPHVVVTTGSGEFVKWGHFRPDSWKSGDEKFHEFFLSSEALAKGAHQVLQTTIHEAAHTLSRVRGQKDTSRQGRYHNKVFLGAARELGLEHRSSTPDRTHGFAFVTLTEATKQRYADLLAQLDKELVLTGSLLPAWMGGTNEEDEKGGERIGRSSGGGKVEVEVKAKGGNLKATCGCPEPLIIRLSRKVLETRAVCCELCGCCFKEA
jgi:hypothetical protein